MCFSVPKQVVAWDGGGDDAGDFAWVERHGERERLNMMLVGPQPVGTWVLGSFGFAKEVVATEALPLIEEALEALAASLDGDYDPDRYFQDLNRP